MMRRESGVIVDERGAARRPRDGRWLAVALVGAGALVYVLLQIAVHR